MKRLVRTSRRNITSSIDVLRQQQRTAIGRSTESASAPPCSDCARRRSQRASRRLFSDFATCPRSDEERGKRSERSETFLQAKRSAESRWRRGGWRKEVHAAMSRGPGRSPVIRPQNLASVLSGTHQLEDLRRWKCKATSRDVVCEGFRTVESVQTGDCQGGVPHMRDLIEVEEEKKPAYRPRRIAAPKHWLANYDRRLAGRFPGRERASTERT